MFYSNIPAYNVAILCYDRILLSPIAYSALLLSSVIQEPTYKPPSLIYNSLNLLSSLHTPIWSQIYIDFNIIISLLRTPLGEENWWVFYLSARSKRPSLIKNTLNLFIIQTPHIQKKPSSQPTSFERTHITLLRFSTAVRFIKKRVLYRLSKIFFSVSLIKFPRTKSTII